MYQATVSAVRLSKFSANACTLSPEVVAALEVVKFHARVYASAWAAYEAARDRCYRSNGPAADECDKLFDAAERHQKKIREAINIVSDVLRASTGGSGLSDGLFFTLAPERPVWVEGLADEIAKHLTNWADDGDDCEYAAFPRASKTSKGQPVVQFSRKIDHRQQGTLVAVYGETAKVRHIDGSGYVFKTKLRHLRQVPDPIFNAWQYVRDCRAAIEAEVKTILTAA